MDAQRTFPGDPNPPPTAKGIPAAAAPAVRETADISAETPQSMAQQPAGITPAPAANFWVSGVQGDGHRRLYIDTPDGPIERGAVDDPDIAQVLEAAGAQKDPISGSYRDVPQALFESLAKGEAGIGDHVVQMYATGKAGLAHGMIGFQALSGEISWDEAVSSGDMELLKMQTNEFPSAVWRRNKLTALAATSKWALGTVAKIIPSLEGAAGAGAQKAPAVVAGSLAMGAATGPVGFAAVANPVAFSAMLDASFQWGAFDFTAKTTMGSVALEMKKNGFSDKTIKATAVPAGIIAGALEVGHIKYLPAPFRRKFLSTVLGNDAVKQTLGKAMGSYLKELGAETSIEAAQQLTEEVSKNLAAKMEGRTDLVLDNTEIAKLVGTAALEAAVGIGAIKIPGAVMEGHSYARAQRSAARAVKTAISVGEMDAKTMSHAAIEKQIIDINVPGMVKAAESVEKALESDKAFEAGKSLASNEEALAAAQAKAEAVNIKKDAVLDGKDLADLTPEQQAEVAPLIERSAKVAEVLSGMEAAIKEKLAAKEEPVAPVKEPKTPGEFVERRYSEQAGVLRNLEKESAALDRELTNINTDIEEAIAEGRSTVSLSRAADKIAERIIENDAKAAEVIMTPMGAEEELAQELISSGAEATVRASDLIRMERSLIDRVERARSKGEAYAKREVKRVQQYIQELIKRSSMTAEQKSKFMAVMRNTQTVEQLEQNYPEIRDRIFEAEDITRQRNAAAVLKKILAKSKSKPAGRRPQGRVGDPDVQAIVDDVHKIMKARVGDAQAAVAEAQMAAEAAFDNNDPVAQARALYSMLANMYRAGQLSTKEGISFVSDIAGMVSGAKAKYLERAKAKAEARAALVKEVAFGEVARGIEPETDWRKHPVEDREWQPGRKIPAAIMGLYGKYVENLWSMGDLLARRSEKPRGESVIEELLTFDKEAALRDTLVQDATDRVAAEMDAAYNITGKHEWARAAKRRKLLHEIFAKQEIGEFINANNKKDVMVYSRAQAIDFYMKLKDPLLQDNIFKAEASAFTQEMKNEMLGILTEGDKKMAEVFLAEYRRAYPAINAKYRATRLVNLPYNEFYSPLKVLKHDGKTGKLVEMDEAPTIHPRTTMGTWAVARVKHSHPIVWQNAFSAFFNHVADTSHYLAFESKIRDVNSLMTSGDFKAAVIGTYGREVWDALGVMVERTTTQNSERRLNSAKMDEIISNLAKANVAGKLLAVAKQLTSMPAFLEGVPLEDMHLWAYELSKIIATRKLPKDWLDSGFVRSRGLPQTREFRIAHETAMREGSPWGPNVSDILGLPVMLGDKASILLGGSALFNYYRSKGLSVEAAIDKTAQVARRTQSSGAISDLSVLQSTSGLGRFFTLYKNNPVQFIRLEISALRNAMAEGRLSRKEAAKTIAIFHLVIPMFFQAVVDAGWDEDHQLRAAILGPFNELPLFGDFIVRLYELLLKEQGLRFGEKNVLEGAMRDFVEGMDEVGQGIAKGNVDHFVKGLTILTDPVFKVLWGIPTKPVVAAAQGLAEIVEAPSPDSPKAIDGFKKVVGYSPFMVKEQRARENKGRLTSSWQ